MIENRDPPLPGDNESPGIFARAVLPPDADATFLATEAAARRRFALWCMPLALAIYLQLVMVSRYAIPDVPGDLMVLCVCAVVASFAVSLTLLLRDGFSARVHDWGLVAFGGCLAAASGATSSQSALPAALVFLNATPLVFIFAINVVGLSGGPAAALCAVVIAAELHAISTSPLSSTGILATSGCISMTMAACCLVTNWCLVNERRRNFLSRWSARESLRTISQQRDLLETLAAVDPLTGLANRRGFDSMLEKDLAALQPGSAIGFAMIDIDRFKAYNDAYGHLRGDEVLRHVGRALSAACEGQMRAARLGGEEFAVVVPGVHAQDLAGIGERLRGAVEALAIPHAESRAGTVVTISVGLALAPVRDGTMDLQAAFAQADAALYTAKRGGRNRVIVASRAATCVEDAAPAHLRRAG